MHVNIGIGDYKADVVEGMAKGGLRKETGFNQNLEGEAGGEGKMYAKSNVETYITICKIDSQWEFAVCLRKPKQGL